MRSLATNPEAMATSSAPCGDEMYVRTQGSATMKNEVIENAEGTWSFTGGTGKLRGVKGKGTYKGKGEPDGPATYEVEGEYQIPE